MSESFEEVCRNIKACLNTDKNQTSMFDLDRDYNSILGTKIPFQSLGFRSLESLLRAVPDLKITQIGRDIFIDAKVDEKTRHITDLVKGQKTNKKKPPTYRRYGYRPPPPRRPTPPKFQFKPTNSRYGSQNIPPKQYEQPRYPIKSYNDQKYNFSNVSYNHTRPPSNFPSVSYNDPRPPSKFSVDSKASAAKDSKPSIYKHPDDPRSNAPRYNSESQNKAPKYYKVPEYNSRTDSNHLKNNHSSHIFENSRLPKKSPSPQISPTFSDSDDDSAFLDLTVNGHTKPQANLQNLLVTSGSSRKVTVSKRNSRNIPNNLSKHNSLDEDMKSSLMSSYSKYSIQTFNDEDYTPRNSASSFHRNHNPRRGGKSTPSRCVEQEVLKYENLRVTIENDGPRNYIQLFYEDERRRKR